jgi:acyl carrier protein
VALTRDAIVQIVFDFVRSELLTVGPEFTTRSNLVEAGLESLGLTQLMLCIEEKTGVWIDESLLTPETLESVETLADCVYEQLPE